MKPQQPGAKRKLKSQSFHEIKGTRYTVNHKYTAGTGRTLQEIILDVMSKKLD